MKTNFSIKQVPETKFGNGELKHLKSYIQFIGSERILLIVDRQMVEKKLTDRIAHHLEAHFPSTETFIIDEKILSFDGIERALTKLDLSRFDMFIGFGGWRCTDLAKSLALIANNPGLLQSMRTGEFANIRRGYPVLSIPTTPLNGAEIDTQILIRDLEKAELIPIEHPYLAPRMAIIDPELMLTLPRDLTTATGLDALSHAIEALVSLECSPFSEILSLQSIALINENLKDAFKDQLNIRARYNVALGSLFAAIALNMTGSGLIHSLAYPLTGRHAISHAQATALISLHALEYNVPVVPHQFVRVARLLGCPVEGVENEAILAVETLKTLYQQLEQPINLSSYQISGGDLKALVQSADRFSDLFERNPRRLENEDLLTIYRRAL